MRRSGFKKPSLDEVKAKQRAKRESTMPLRASKLPRKEKKPKKPTLRTLKEKLWLECKRITRERFPNICYTCGQHGLEKHNWQTGHGKAKGALPLRFQYDIRNLRPQCYQCNHEGNGMTDIFIAKLETEPEGQEFLQEACYFDEDDYCWKIRRDIPSMGSIEAYHFVSNLLEQYKNFSPANHMTTHQSGV